MPRGGGFLVSAAEGNAPAVIEYGGEFQMRSEGFDVSSHGRHRGTLTPFDLRQGGLHDKQSLRESDLSEIDETASPRQWGPRFSAKFSR